MSFEVLSAHYRWMELVLAGEKLQRCRTRFFNEIGEPHAILLAGEGPGRCLLACGRRFPHASVTYLDASSGMLRQAETRLARSGLKGLNVEFVQADVLEWSPSPRTLDLIITNFFLDCFPPEQLAQVVRHLATGANAGANWLLADFQLPGRGWKQLRARLILWAMYLFFQSVTRIPACRLTRPDAFLYQAGFRLHRRLEAEWGLLHSDWWHHAGGEAHGI